MFMQRGKHKTSISNTGPHDTDAAMFFRMMKNCKLFEIENENHLYDDIIECRDRLHHSATNRIPRETAKSYFDMMIVILEKFDVPGCKTAISRIKQMLKETILCISMPDMNIRELAKETLKQKKSALEVDKETDKAKGINDGDTDELLKDTNTALVNAEYSENTFDGSKSTEDYKRQNHEISKLKEENESLGCRQKPVIWSGDMRNKVKNPHMFFELMTSLLQKSLHKPYIAADIEAQLNPVLDQIVGTASERDASFRKEAEDISEQVNNCERTDKQQQSNTQPGNSNITAGGQTGRKKDIDMSETSRNKDTDIFETVKDPLKHFENMTSLLKKYAHKHEIAEAISKNINHVLDAVVEAASKSDETLRQTIEEVYELENFEQETRKDIDQSQLQNQDANKTDDGERNIYKNGADLNTGNADSLRLHQPSATTKVEQVPGIHRPHLWSVDSKQSYTITAEQERCIISGCCQLPRGEILLVDFENKRLKKLDSMYQVMSVCYFTDHLGDICYIGNNEAVVSSCTNELQFVDVECMTLTRSVEIVHKCYGLACHGTKLYVLAPDSVYVYRTDGTEQRVLYTLPGDISIFSQSCSIAVNGEGNKIYIATSGHLINIDSSGNHLFTLADQDLNSVGRVCVDGEGYVLVCNATTGSILQVSHDGKHILGTIVNISDENPAAIFFDRHKSTLICAGRSDNVTILQLKKVPNF